MVALAERTREIGKPPEATARCQSVLEAHSPLSRSFHDSFVASEKIGKEVLFVALRVRASPPTKPVKVTLFDYVE